MNLTKKLAALVLAMMMALSVMAMPAAAYEAGHEHAEACCADEIMSRKPAMECPKCHVAMTYEENKDSIGAQYRFVCPECGMSTKWMDL